MIQFTARTHKSTLLTTYRKIPKISPGAYNFQRPFLRGLYLEGLSIDTEGNLRFKIDLASLLVGRKFTVFALFYFVFVGNFQVQASPWGEGGWGLYMESLFSEFNGIPHEL